MTNTCYWKNYNNIVKGICGVSTIFSSDKGIGDFTGHTIDSHMKESIQKTLDGKLTGYYGLNAFGEKIYIPNFQPLPYDDNPRLDQENIKGKRKNNK